MNFKELNHSKKNIIIVSATIILMISLIIVAFSFDGNDINEINVPSQYESSNFINYSSEISDDFASDVSFEASDVFNDISQGGDESVSDKEIAHGFVQNRFGITYVYGDTGFEQFSYKMTALDRYINSFNYIAEIVPERTRLFNITVPVSSTFAQIPYDIYTEDGFYNKSQATFVSTVGSEMNGRFTNVSVVEILKEHYNNGENIFFRTDKNWTSLAAYYAYAEFCNYANIIPYQIEELIKTDVGEFLGSFYNATLSEDMRNNPDRFVAYEGNENIQTALTVYDSGLVIKNYNLCNNEMGADSIFDYYLGTNAGRYEIGTTANGGSILIIGDSSVCPMVPFLACHYTKIDYINPSEFEMPLSEFLEKHSYDDVLTMCYSTNAINGDYIPTLNALTGVNIDE